MNTRTLKTKVSLIGTFIWSIAAMFYLYEFFLRNVLGTVAGQVIKELHLNPETFALLGTAYFVIYGVMQIPVGILCDKFGVKNNMLLALALCVISSLMLAFSNHFAVALISRMLMGLGSAFAFVCLLVIVINWFPREYFGFFTGISQLVGTLGPLLAAGPLMTFIISMHETWRAPLIDASFFGGLLFILALFFVKTKPRNAKSIFFIERTEPVKLQIKRLIKSKQAWLIAVYSSLAFAPIGFLGAVWGTEYMELKGFSDSEAAYLISISWIGYAIGCPLLGLFTDLIKRRKPALIIASIAGFVSMLGIILCTNTNFVFYSILFLALGVAAAGQNIGFPTIIENVDQNIKSSAIGFNNASIMIVSAILPLLVSWFIYKQAGDSQLVTHDFIVGFMIIPLMYIVCLIISLFFIKETYCKPQKEAIILEKK